MHNLNFIYTSSNENILIRNSPSQHNLSTKIGVYAKSASSKEAATTSKYSAGI